MLPAMTTTKVALALSIALAGCKGGAAPSCDDALAQAAKVAPKLADKKVMADAVAECVGEKWSDDLRSCVANIKEEKDAIACMAKTADGAKGRKKEKMTEAGEYLNAIGKMQKRAYGENSSFTVGNGAFLPTGVSATNGCCGMKGGTETTPGTTVNNKCKATPSAFRADPLWGKMAFSVDEEGIYGYSFVGTSATSFTAYAIGDADCDEVAATFTLQGTIDAAGNPSVNLIKPPPGVF